jgi:hypothetical protein
VNMVQILYTQVYILKNETCWNNSTNVGGGDEEKWLGG